MPSINQHLLRDTDPFRLFDQMGVSDPSHAFYLGYEMMKARTALTLSKTYRQDQALEWGFLTLPEASRIARRDSQAQPDGGPAGGSEGGSGIRRLRRGAGVILEGIVTTLSSDDLLNVAPMGPEVDPAGRHASVRPPAVSGSRRPTPTSRRGARASCTSRTMCCCWPRRRSGRPIDPFPATRPTSMVAGAILADACRYYEFRVIELDDRDDRTRIVAETVAQGRQRDFFGFNRAKHAVLEAAILATRTAWLPLRDLLLEFRKLEVLVSKTGGPAELAAFSLAVRVSPRGRRPSGRRPRPEAHSTMTGPRLLVRTPGRLHFGLLGWGPGSLRQFGGLGLMIESPGIELTVEPAPTQVVQRTARRIGSNASSGSSANGCRHWASTPRPVVIRIVQAPPEHVGLGVGTQISLAIAAAVLRLAGVSRSLGGATGPA